MAAPDLPSVAVDEPMTGAQFELHSAQALTADEETVLLRLEGPGALPAAPALVLAGEQRIAALPGPPPASGRWQAAFAVPAGALRAHDGPLVLETNGARVTFPRVVPPPETRPLLGARRDPSPPPAPARATPGAAQVLVVDDDELIRAAVQATLEGEGYGVTTAADGAEALERLREALPDLVVSDVDMPDVDGLGLVARLREDPATRGLPLIFLTSMRDPEDVVAGLELGADDYVTKPFEPGELVARVRGKLARRPVPAELLRHDPRTGVLAAGVLRDELRREIERAGRGGRPGCLALLELDELPTVRDRLGDRAEDAIALRLAGLVADGGGPLDVVGRLDRGRFALLLPETGEGEAERRLEELSRRIVRTTFAVAGEKLRLSPTVGFTTFGRGSDAAQAEQEAAAALGHAKSHLDVRPTRFAPAMLAAPAPKKARPLRKRLATPSQILATQVLGLVLPFFVYWGLDEAGFDITWPVYLVVVAALLMTSATIWIEGFLALERPAPPDEAGAPYPKASAIIAAYLPNEAATVIETVEAFLAQEYPADIQVVLAYNTPYDMPIEEELRAMGERDPRFVPYRVEHSTSKAQNVNTALAIVEGELVGVFDADHQPAPTSFDRAWRWLSNGYDVVQGHCVVRNGEVSWVARTVAVEFESIYAVSHPGRARFHDFGIFGGTNGFWKTDLLREIRMRGSMLTEDIDSSMRVIEQGGRIASDPNLLSRELGPASLTALWNQRMRWAQGWFQVSMQHLGRALRSRHLSVRQKIGAFYLLGWREIYPWLSLQMFPIVAYWIFKYGSDELNWLVPLFVATTIFTLGTGPAQTFFAYRLAAPEVRARRRWFLWYFVTASLFYTEFKNQVARVAQIKEVVGEREWKVTPRA